MIRRHQYHPKYQTTTRENNTSRSLNLLQAVPLLVHQVLLVRELVLGAPVPRDLERLQHGRRDKAAVSGLLHERRDGLQMRPALLARDVREVRGAVKVAMCVRELENDAMHANLHGACEIRDTMANEHEGKRLTCQSS